MNMLGFNIRDLSYRPQPMKNVPKYNGGKKQSTKKETDTIVTIRLQLKLISAYAKNF